MQGTLQEYFVRCNMQLILLANHPVPGCFMYTQRIFVIYILAGYTYCQQTQFSKFT